MNRDGFHQKLLSESGQLFMSGIPGPSLDRETETLIRDYHIGGVILFARNIEGPMQLASLCRELQEKAMACHGVPLLLTIDQEGGRVARLKEPFTLFPGNEAIGKDRHPLEKASHFGSITAKEMKMVGLNMDLAPVVDVRQGLTDKHLEGRCFGDDPEKVALMGKAVVRSLQINGIMAVAKHFPGLGSAGMDPHFHLFRIEAGQEEMEKVHLFPFRAAIEEGVSGIMTSHAIYPTLDTERPATLSHSLLSGLLRNTMGFEGLIITDDLEMGAIAHQWGVAEGAVAAFEAGADILLICKGQENLVEGLELLRKKIWDKEIHYNRLELSMERVRRIKSRFLNNREEISLAYIKEYFHL